MTLAPDRATTAAGHDWDALRIPSALGVCLWRKLASDPGTRGRLGPIVVSERSQATYWFIPTGTSDTAWPRYARLLTRGSWLLLPGQTADPRCARWLHQLDRPGQFTEAVWLAAALRHHTAQETIR
jgi:hypothetical protein